MAIDQYVLSPTGPDQECPQVTLLPVSSFGSIFKGIQGPLSCCKKRSTGRKHVTNRSDNRRMEPLAFALRLFVVDLDTQLVPIRHLQYNPGFGHGSANNLSVQR